VSHQGIIRDSPRYDSSYDRGRAMKVRYGRAQLTLGLEEALADMHPGDAKMVLLTPDLAYACPVGKVRFAALPPP
jgi:FKBP-type peptidyl-prolyl cis-trans isomerase 2